jgi:phenylalanyl-tRNA synthetase beta chain
VDTVRIYEMGRTYHPDPQGGQGMRPPTFEKLAIAGLVHGRRNGRTWTSKDESADFYDAKGGVEAVLQSLGIREARFVAADHAELHPRATAEIRIGDQVVGYVGELHAKARTKLDLPAGVFLFALSFDVLLELTTLVPKYQPPTKFPAVLRDLAVVVPTALEHEAVRKVIREVGGALVEDATLFDVYTGKPIPEGQKNLAYALRYRSPDRTLTDVEVNDAHAKIVAEVTKRLGGTLRA